MTKSLNIAAAAMLIIAMPAQALAQQTRIDCEANLIATQHAIDAALRAESDRRRAATAAGAGAGCALFSLLMLGMDAGMTSLVCGIVTAGTYVAMTPQESSEISRNVYARMRDPRCVPRRR